MNVLNGILGREKQAPVSCFHDLAEPPTGGENRVVTTGGYYAHLKIAEGCDKRCTYCIIPYLRGSFRSVPMEQLVQEAGQLAEQGVKELILVAQETTLYGKDQFLPVREQFKGRVELQGLVGGKNADASTLRREHILNPLHEPAVIGIFRIPRKYRRVPVPVRQAAFRHLPPRQAVVESTVHRVLRHLFHTTLRQNQPAVPAQSPDFPAKGADQHHGNGVGGLHVLQYLLLAVGQVVGIMKVHLIPLAL